MVAPPVLLNKRWTLGGILPPGTPPLINWNSPLAEGLAFCVPGYEGTGNVLHELVNNLSATEGLQAGNVFPAQWDSSPIGAFGAAKEFGDSGHTAGSYFEFGTSTNQNGIGLDTTSATAKFTLMAWVKPFATGAANGTILARYSATFGRAWNFGLASGDFTAVQLVVSTSGSASTHALTTATGSTPLGKWTHVAITIDVGAATANIYINGDLSITDTGLGTASGFFASTAPLAIGMDKDGTDDPYYGWQQDHRIYNRVLTRNEIKQVSSGFDGLYLSRSSLDPLKPAYLRVQGKASNAFGPSTAYAITLDAAVTSGNAVTGIFNCGDNPTTLNSVTDDKGNTYNLESKVVDSGGQACWAFSRTNITNGPVTLTANVSSSSSFLQIIVEEYSGVSTASTDERDGSHNAGQSSPGTGTDGISSGTFTTAVNGDLIWGGEVGSASGAAVPTVGTNFTAGMHENAGDHESSTEFRTQATAGAGTAATFTQAVNTRRATFAIALKPAGAGGTVYSVSIAETGSAADSQSSLVVFPSSVAETTASSDAPSSLATLPSANTDSAAASDATSSVATLPAANTESAAASDATSSIATLVAADSESTAASDAPSSIATLPATDAEATTASDSQSSAATLPAAESESVAASDTQDGTIGANIYGVSQDETAAASDDVSSSATLPATSTESVATADSPSAIATLAASDSESVTAADTQDGILNATYAGSQSETASAADTTDATVISLASATDNSGGGRPRHHFTKQQQQNVEKAKAELAAAERAEEKAVEDRKTELRAIVQRKGASEKKKRARKELETLERQYAPHPLAGHAKTALDELVSRHKSERVTRAKADLADAVSSYERVKAEVAVREQETRADEDMALVLLMFA